MRMVRGPGATHCNALELGPLHTDVRDHCQKIISNPELLLDTDVDEDGVDWSYLEAAFDGEKWDRPDILQACRDLAATLPHLREMVIAFFEGALAGWIRFSSEYVSGGRIDQATSAERELVYMPATNDVNEGLLGSFRVFQRRFPTITLHQFNALTIFSRNGTQQFMDALFALTDHQHIRKEARKVDASGLEAQRRQEQHDFEVRLVAMKRKKAEEKERHAREVLDHLAGVTLIEKREDIWDPKMTISRLNDQLETLRTIWKDAKIPLKSHMKLKVDKQKALEEAFLRHQEMLQGLEDTICEELEKDYALAASNSEPDSDADEEEDADSDMDTT